MAWSISLAKQTKKTNIKHNNRELSDKARQQNPHIDESRSPDNQYLVRKDIRAIYEREFGEALKNYNTKQKRSDRQIKDYYKHIQASKKTAVQQEMIVQVGDIDDFAGKDGPWEVANEVLQTWFQEFEEWNPQLHVYNAVIHNDEASPHMHVNFVPVAGGYKRGLEKQVSFDRAITQQDKTLDQNRPFDAWREQETGQLETLLNERAIERERVGTNDYEDVNDYKVKKQLERDIKELRGVLSPSNQEPPYLKKETESVKTGLMKSEERETGNVVLSPEQYEQVNRQIHAADAIKEDYDRLQETDLVQENRDLREIQSEILDENIEWEKENGQLKEQVQEIEAENSSLKAHINDLKQNIGVIYQYAKKTLQDAFKDFQESIDIELGALNIENHFRQQPSSKRKEQEHDMDM